MGDFGREERELTNEIRRYVLNRMGSPKVKVMDLAARTHQAMSLSDGGARSFICSIRNYSTVYPLDQKYALPRLSVLLSGLGTPEEEPIIQKLKNAYESFNYPPVPCDEINPDVEERLKGRYLAGEAERLLAFTEKFRKLNPSDAKFVENLVDRLT